MAEFDRELVSPGPADTRYTAATLARVAFMEAAADLADEVAKLVDPQNHECIVLDARDLMDSVKHLIGLAVVAEYEGGDPNFQLGSRPLEDSEFGPVIRAWRKSLERPWYATDSSCCDEANEMRIESTLPEGASDPERTCAALDAWCDQHLARSRDSMISATLRPHTAQTEADSVDRHEQYLELCDDATAREWAAHRARAKRVNGHEVRPHPDQEMLNYDQIPGMPYPLSWGDPVWDAWPEIVAGVRQRDPALYELVKLQSPVAIAKGVVALGNRDPDLAACLNDIRNRRTVRAAIRETTGLEREVRVVSAPAMTRWAEESAKPPF